MHRNLDTSNPMRPLTIGNVVNAGLQLYNSNLKTYFQITMIATLWLLVPIYGWAKYSAYSALISRLAFAEVVGQPESVESARNKLMPRMWSFLGVALGIGLRLFGIYLGLYLMIILTFVGLAVTLGQRLGFVVGGIVAVVLVIYGLILLVRFYSRWVIAEVPMAVEENIKGRQSIQRSWDLTKAAVGRVQGIVVVAFLVTLPIQVLTSLPQFFFRTIRPSSLTYWLLLAISLVGGAVIMPFWQAIKAVLYYDLRTRREGLDLQLHSDAMTDEESF